jgi:hypothetical protein
VHLPVFTTLQHARAHDIRRRENHLQQLGCPPGSVIPFLYNCCALHTLKFVNTSFHSWKAVSSCRIDPQSLERIIGFSINRDWNEPSFNGRGFTLQELRILGCNYHNLRSVGFSCAEIRSAGVDEPLMSDMAPGTRFKMKPKPGPKPLVEKNEILVPRKYIKSGKFIGKFNKTHRIVDSKAFDQARRQSATAQGPQRSGDSQSS